jgi:hypothetical protein
MPNINIDSKGRFAKGIKIEKECLNCGKHFFVNPCCKNQKYCSHKCSHEYTIKTGNRRIRAQKPCPICGKIIEERPCRVKKVKYCSYECSVEAKKKRIKQICPTCSTEFETTPDRIKRGKGKYCSHDCWCKNRNKVATVIIKCKHCGKDMKMLRSNAFNTATDNSPRRLFCSQKCYNNSEHFEAVKEYLKTFVGEKASGWKGGISFEPYCPKFNHQLREKIRERDNRTCQHPDCGIKENGRRHAVHHIHYDKPNCTPDLITLCGRCNSKVNANRDYWEAYFMELLKKRGLLGYQ